MIPQAMLLPDLIPDVEDCPELRSFAEIRRRNLQTIYGDANNDKSPKGSIDEKIASLVDIINAHPSFVTLSSCSGRIAVFDSGQAAAARNEENVENLEEERTAKGTGRWLLASHDEVEPASVLLLLEQAAKNKLTFKFEPFLLHVAASSLTRGQQLLQLALQLGLRESGLVVTDTRITVCLRWHSLALAVPMGGAFRLPTDYILALVDEANKRLERNQLKLNQLKGTIQSTLFWKRNDKLIRRDTSLCIEELPALHLWGHASIAVPMEGQTHIYVFGGYGTGTGTGGKLGRSNRVYCLHVPKKWTDLVNLTWSQVQLDESSSVSTIAGIPVTPTHVEPREGIQACIMPTIPELGLERIVVLFGGRASPMEPVNDLLLFEPQSCYFCKPTRLLGTVPSPRWGHTLTSLSGKNGMVALLVGGRDDAGSCSDVVYVLRVAHQRNNETCLAWVQVSTTTIPPQFHHTVTTIIPDADAVLLFQGRLDPSNLLESFGQERDSSSGIFSAHTVVYDESTIEIAGSNDWRFPNMEARYGATVVSLTPGEGKRLVARIGGIPCAGGTSAVDIEWFQVDIDTQSVSPCPMGGETSSIMAHHTCVVNSENELFVVGGGVSAFAFGATFGESFRMRLVESGGLVNEQTKVATGNSSIDAGTFVIYVAPRDAKTLREALAEEKLLDKSFRMIKEGERCAVPVLADAYNRHVEHAGWKELVLGAGSQVMPLSTAILGSSKQKKRR